MSHTHLNIFSSIDKFDKNLYLHKLCTKIKKRKRTIKMAIWDIDYKDRSYPISIKEDYVFFMITLYKKMGIDILILFNSLIEGFNHWYGYNSFVAKNVLILWNQNIILRPIFNVEKNVIIIKELKGIISLNGEIDYVGNLSNLEKNVLFNNRARDFIVGCFKTGIFKDDSQVVAKINILDNIGKLCFIGKTLTNIKYINTPFDLNDIALIDIFKEVECTLGPRIMKIQTKDAIKDVKRILNNEEPKSIPKIKTSFNWRAIRGEFGTMSYLMGKIIVNQVAPIFKKWNGIWAGFRREPFLGKTIPKSVRKSYEDLLGHKGNKQYYIINIPDGVDMDTFGKDNLRSIFYIGDKLSETERVRQEKIKVKMLLKNIRGKTSSKAANFDLYQLKDIVKALRSWIEDTGVKAIRGSKEDQQKIRRLLSNIINLLNRNSNKQIMGTFFLLKNAKLESASDTRMIVIAPTLLKIFEVITYNEVILQLESFISKDEDKWQYQKGARIGGSTTKAMVELRDKVEQKRADGVLMLDITKGYESVDLFMLNDAIKALIGYSNLRLKFLLLAWVTFVFNIDIMISGKIIKKTKGIPMGLMFSPLMFVIYVNYCLRNIFKDNLIMYIDDIAIILNTGKNLLLLEQERNNDNDPVKYIKSIVGALESGGLLINFNKAVLITSSIELKNQIKSAFNKVKIGDSIKYLGREVLIKGDLLLPGDMDVTKGITDLIRQIPLWSPLIIRLCAFNGGLEGRSRFQAMMWEVSLVCKKNLINRAFLFYGLSFENLSIIQLLFLLGNYFKLSFNAFSMLKWQREDKLNNNVVSPQIAKARMDVIKNALLMDIPDIDNITKNNFDIWFDYEFISKSFKDDYFVSWNKLSEKVWNRFRYMIISVFWEKLHDDDVESEKFGYAWRKIFCWILGVNNHLDKKKEMKFFSLVNRFAFLLDIAFCEFKNDNFMDLIFSLDQQIENLFANIISFKEMNLIKLDPIFDDYDSKQIGSNFLSKVAFVEAINKDSIDNISKNKNWKFMIDSVGGNLKKLFDLLSRDLPAGGKSLDEIQHENKLFKKGLMSLRSLLIKWLIVLDSIYKDGNIEFRSWDYMTAYVNVMFSLYSQEIDKQVQIFEVVNFQLDEDNRFIIDSNIEYNYISHIQKIDFSL